MSTLSKLLQGAKELNIPRRNFMSKADPQKVIKDTIIKYEGHILGVDNPICIKRLDELEKK